MDVSDTTKAQVARVQQSQEDDKQRVLESAISTVSAVKRLLTEYDRVKGERDNFERQLASTLVENETLRRQAKEAKDHRDHFSKALTTLTAQMDAIGTRCIEAVKMVRSQAYDQVSTMPANRISVDGRNLTEQSASPSPAAAGCQTSDQAAAMPGNGEPDSQNLAEQSTPLSGPIAPSAGNVQVFTQYLAQQRDR
jgi:seryl-tRNA synthetase